VKRVIRTPMQQRLTRVAFAVKKALGLPYVRPKPYRNGRLFVIFMHERPGHCCRVPNLSLVASIEDVVATCRKAWEEFLKEEREAMQEETAP